MRTIVLVIVIVLSASGRARAQDAAPGAERSVAVDAAAAEPALPEAPEPPALSWGPIRVDHVPLHSARSGEVSIEFDVAIPGELGTILVRWRDLGGEDVREAEVRRVERGFAAVLAPVRGPGFEYWVVRLGAEGQSAIFASEESPHPVIVVESYRDERERRGLEIRGGHRARVRAFGEWVDFGHRRVGGVDVPDEYWHAAADFTYAFLDVVEEIRVEGGTYRGEVANVRTSPAAQRSVGLDYGRAELTLYLLDVLRVRGFLLLGFSQGGFDGGGGGELVIGDPGTTYVALGGQGITRLGFTTWARLGFDVIPIIPCGATLEVTNFPSGDDVGVRLLFDLGVEIYPGALIRARGGYQSRTASTGGVSAEALAAFAF